MSLLHKVVPFNYECVECNNVVDWWPFANVNDYPRNYAADFLDKVIHCVLIWIIYLREDRRFKEFAFMWFVMSVFIAIEWLLTRNEPWIYLPLLGYKGISHIFIIFKGLIVYKVLRICLKK